MLISDKFKKGDWVYMVEHPTLKKGICGQIYGSHKEIGGVSVDFPHLEGIYYFYKSHTLRHASEKEVETYKIENL